MRATIPAARRSCLALVEWDTSGSRQPSTHPYGMRISRREGNKVRGPAVRLMIDERGYANLARRIPSPNCDERPPGAAVTLAVIHGISLPPGEFGGDAIARFFTNRLDPAAHPFYASIAHLHVSAHFLLRRDGRLLQFVSCNERAWHAGVSRFRGRTHCNDFSIGVELEGADNVR